MTKTSRQSLQSGHVEEVDQQHGIRRRSAQDEWLPVWAWALLIGCLAFLLGLRSLSFGFAYDDFWTILDNHYLHSPYGLAGLFDRTAASLGVADAGRPVMVAIHWFEWRLFGARSSPYHVVDLLLHAATTAMLFAVLAELSGRKLLAAAAALLFAAHPLHAEVFAVTSFREDSLVTFFGLAWWAGLLLARRWRAAASTRRAWAIEVLSAVLFVLALGSKESGAALLPGVWLATAVARRQGPWAELKAGRWGYGSAAFALAGLLLFRLWSFGTLAPYSGPLYPHPGDLWHLGLLSRLGLAAKATFLGLGRFLWPFRLAPEYCLLSVPSNPASVAWILAGLALAALPVWLWMRAVSSRRRAGVEGPDVALIAAGMLFALATFAPTSNLFWMPNTEADRFWYLPSVGLVLALAAILSWATRHLAARVRFGLSTFPQAWHPSLRQWMEPWLGRPGVWFVLVLAPLVLILAGILIGHLPVYRNDPTLWSVAWKQAPCSPRAAVGQATGLLHRGRIEEASRLARKALALRPGFPPARFLLARIAEAQGHYGEAFRLYRRALRAGYWEPWRCHVGMAATLSAQGRLAAARRQLAMARLLAPHQVTPNLLSFGLAWRQGDPMSAGLFLARALGAPFF